MDIQEMVAELEEYYENAGFADFYEKVLKDKTDKEIQLLFEETFSGEKELFEYAQSHGFDESDEYNGADGVLEKLQSFMAAKAGGGDPEAQYLFGKYILDNSNAQVDVAWAAEMISSAAMQGHEEAKELLKGIGVSEGSLTEPENVDEKKLLHLAEAGDPEAQYQMGISFMAFEQGENAEFSKALDWFAKAADNGHEMAANQLRFWTYVDKLMNRGEVARNADFMDIMSLVIEKAAAGDPEARVAQL